MSEFEYISCCPVCGNIARKLLHSDLEDILYGKLPGKWSMYTCNSCGAAYLNPRLYEKDIITAYQSYYTHEKPVKDQRVGKLKYVKESLRNGFKNYLLETNFQPSNRLGIVLFFLNYNRRQRIIREARSINKKVSKGRLLDIGCGNGEFLLLARKMGWEVEGTDFDEKAVNAAKTFDLNVKLAGTNDLDAFHDCQFDYITLSHVIEHVYEPQKLISECYRMLKPGGVLWIETPNIEGLGHKYFKRFWRGLEPPRHIIVYSYFALKILLNNAGFKNTGHLPIPFHQKRFFRNSRLIQQEIKGSLPIAYRVLDFFRGLAYYLRSLLNPLNREVILISSEKK